MKRLHSLGYAVFFLPLAAAIGVLTVLLKLLRFKNFVGFCHRPQGGHERVLYLEPFFPKNAGYHYRARKWAYLFSERGVQTVIKHVWDRETFEQLLAQGRMERFQAGFLLCRLMQCFASARYDCVIVRRELLLYNDYGHLFLEKFLLAWHPHVILDFDDDISAAKREPRAVGLYGRVMREHPAKFRESLRLYSRFIVGSRYLKENVLEQVRPVAAGDVIVVPTAVDYERYAPKEYTSDSDIISFGWVGNNRNLPLLDSVIPALNQVARSHKIRLVVIAGEEYRPAADFEVINLRWSLEQEIENLRRIDIGLMPLPDTPVARGKCAFKLIQYMGLGIVSIASAITVNSEIIEDDKNGFLVDDETLWENTLTRVLQRRNDFPSIGAAARRTINKSYSYSAHIQRYLDFIRQKDRT